MLILSITSLLLVLSSSCTGKETGSERKVEVFWNPNCTVPQCQAEQNNSYVNLVYVKSTGASDIIHTLYTNFPSFTILLFKSELDGVLSINYQDLFDLKPNPVQVTNSKEKAAYLLPRIFEFDDSNGDADMSKINQNSTYFRTYQTSELVWSKFSDYKDAIGVLEGRLTTGNETGSFQFVIRNRGTNSRDKDLPHLLLKPESSSLDFAINNVPASFELSKFGVEFIFAGSDENKLFESTKVTMDDEYTPGTFKIWDFEYKTNEKTVSYFQCKPIFYFYEPKFVLKFYPIISVFITVLINCSFC